MSVVKVRIDGQEYVLVGGREYEYRNGKIYRIDKPGPGGCLVLIVVGVVLWLCNLWR
ncbi:MAG: hypothetical protein LBT09_15890 [Planctomycetaceae bacterium]|jgi:hypothetical protein|nr:hypothetical protein [Planctomycetaceae bacterium]